MFIFLTTVQNSDIFTVSQLNQRAKQLLEISFASIRVEGEISSLSRPSSGHWYFTLKDDRAQVRCAMFRSRTALLKFQPKEGDKVELRGKVSLYENRGDYQLIVDAMKPAGEGALLLAFQQLKERLAAAGWFNEEYKKPLPTAQRVGVITSPTGAAIHDILTVFRRRCPAIEIDLYPTAVQGKEATAQIVAAIERANRDNRVDVLIVGRGGGSLEDLWCFNEEAVAQAIFASAIPVVSAVGHEVDFTIADFVADARAPTPSAAAELLSPDQSQQVQYLTQLRQRLLQGFRRTQQQRRQMINNLSVRVRGPERALQQLAQQTDQLELRLKRAFQVQNRSRQERLQNLQRNLANQHPERRLKEQRQVLQLLEKQITASMRQQLQKASQQLGSQARLLQGLSPLNVLSRGYSITTDVNQSVIQHADQLSAGDRIRSRLQHGWVESEVLQTGNEPFGMPESDASHSAADNKS
ncbi:MAG: exodeoxyribonuclease VII large subunit [Oceanospirillaceae bacterium]|nr:exodeoxyribonuclease VII large subunit [Oceanospirillaceae bacterium]MBS53107.1 exodeoxyribonuclease VII large subunit [Oceanospirillaceae bacterium]